MALYTVDKTACPSNHPCPARRVCPVNAIVQKDASSAPEIDETKCTGCGLCAKYCMYDAFKLK